MIDRTADFVKVLKEKQKENDIPTKPNLLRKPRKLKTTFGVKCKELVSSIAKLRDFLLENKKAYVGEFGYNKSLSDVDRDKIDIESQNIIKSCFESLSHLKETEVEDMAVHTQLNAHKKFCIELIERFLKAVCRNYSELKAIRVKKVVDKKRISRLQTDVVKSQRFQESRLKSEDEQFLPFKMPTKTSSNMDDELSSDEEAAFEQENTQMLNDMNSMMDEVNTIEGKVTEIARLQDMFTEQVLQQSGEIDIISETVVESTENVKDGNEELREAIKNNAGFRVWILFFLVMCSFSLLFLEWYS